jgi:cysteine synthase
LDNYELKDEEILKKCDFKLEMMVCDEGKGGKINGIGRKIKEM